MEALFKHFVAFLVHLGFLGLLVMGILDSSFLFLPLGNDLLVIGMAANAGGLLKAVPYAIVAAAGSVLGCLILDVIGRKGGKAELEKHVPKKRLDYVKKQIKKRAAWALALGALMPPPFPFTPFVAAAAAMQYPRKKLLSVIAATRLIRFSIEATLATYFGRHILSLATNPAVHWFIVGLVFLSVGGSVFSVYGWVKRSKSKTARA
ncbi:MAG TPA: VTT domain-containing protein [Bryobacteraceae bacterium]|nr:VTT domain-containing protein [Bryobacteraceae bacterium]